MIHVLAEIRTRPGERDNFIDDLRSLEPEVRAERGCIEYGGAIDVATSIAVQAPSRENVVMVIEKWDDEAALAAHLDAPHMHAHRARVKPFVEEVIIHVLRNSS
ncbi:MAG: putative quinol monooxygenase [Gemmatimonadaceae bacterium]